MTHDRTRIRNEAPVVIEDAPCAPPDPPWVRRFLRLVAAVTISALLAVGFLGYQLFRTEQRTHALEEYINEVRGLRDKQNKDVNDRINDAVCGILNRLPAGPLLDPLREDYDCGPGLLPSAMTEEQIAEILRDYGPAALARTPAEFYELFPSSPPGAAPPTD